MRSAWGQPIVPRDPSQVRGTAHALLGQAQFRPPGRTLPQKVEHWIDQTSSSLFGGTQAGGFHLPPIVIVAILAVLIAVALVVIARQGGFRRGLRRGGRTSPAVMVSADDLGLTDDVWLARAVAAEEAGDGREGVRCRYRSLVAVLVSAGAVTEEIGRTAGEYRRLVERTVPEGAEAFGTATTTFEEAWYGQVAVGPDQRDVLIAAATPVAEAARHYRRRDARPGRGRGSDTSLDAETETEAGAEVDADDDRTQTVGTGSDR